MARNLAPSADADGVFKIKREHKIIEIETLCQRNQDATITDMPFPSSKSHSDRQLPVLSISLQSPVNAEL